MNKLEWQILFKELTDNKRSEDSILKLLNNDIYKMLLHENFNECKSLLLLFRTYAFSKTLRIGVLRITKPFKEELGEIRSGILQDFEEYSLQACTEKERATLLRHVS